MSTSSFRPDFDPGLSESTYRAGEQVKGKISEIASATAEMVNQNRGNAAAGLEVAAETLHQQADRLPGGERVTEIAHSAADRLSDTAEYVRDNDLYTMVEDVEHLVKKNPGPALAFALGLGFLVGRAINGTARR